VGVSVGTPELTKISLYVRDNSRCGPRRILFVVLNNTDTQREVNVTSDWAMLGISPTTSVSDPYATGLAARAELLPIDAPPLSAPVMIDSNSFKVEVRPRNFRVVEVQAPRVSWSGTP
jgi:hypothetical protein